MLVLIKNYLFCKFLYLLHNFFSYFLYSVFHFNVFHTVAFQTMNSHILEFRKSWKTTVSFHDPNELCCQQKEAEKKLNDKLKNFKMGDVNLVDHKKKGKTIEFLAVMLWRWIFLLLYSNFRKVGSSKIISRTSKKHFWEAKLNHVFKKQGRA